MHSGGGNKTALMAKKQNRYIIKQMVNDNNHGINEVVIFDKNSVGH